MKQDFTHLHLLLERYWAAGFFDGEGCTHLRDNGNGQEYVVINISQAHPEVLERFMAAVGGVGRINGPVSYEGRRDMWFYQATWRPDVEAVRDAIYPYLSSEKQKQMDEKFSKSIVPRTYSKRMKPEVVEALMQDFREGMSYGDIADKYDKTYQAVVKLISNKRKRGLL